MLEPQPRSLTAGDDDGREFPGAKGRFTGGSRGGSIVFWIWVVQTNRWRRFSSGGQSGPIGTRFRAADQPLELLEVDGRELRFELAALLWAEFREVLEQVILVELGEFCVELHGA